MLSISKHTLCAYIESTRFKLGALNTTHAVARALAEGLILMAGLRGPRQADGRGAKTRAWLPINQF
jgi:hypothetical protein